MAWSRSYRYSILLLIVSNIFLMSISPTKMPSRSPESGSISRKTNLLLSARSMSAMDRSAVFMVQRIWRLFGTPNGFAVPLSSFEYGSDTRISSGSPILLESSISVISSPKIFEMFPRLISSIMSTYCFSSTSISSRSSMDSRAWGPVEYFLKLLKMASR